MDRPMKYSGVEWIGDIPEGWFSGRTKNAYSNHKYVVGEKADDFQRLALTLNGVIKRSKEDSNGLQPDAFNGYQILRKNELVFKLIDLENIATSRVGLSPYDGIVSPAYIVLEAREGSNPRYGEYYFISMWQRAIFNQLGDDGVRSSLNAGDLLNIPYIQPPENEQERIADYLDIKCREINDVLEKTRSSIEEYKRLKQEIISQTIFNGLKNDVPVKDSGVEWFGDIPDTWDVLKIGRIGKTSSGATPLRSKDSDFFDDATIRWVKTLDLNDWIVEDSSEKITELALSNSSCNIMPPNTVCVAMYGGAGTIGKSGLLAKECATNQAVCSIVCNENIINPMYLLFQLLAIRQYWMIYAVGTRKDPNISQDIVRKMKIIVPPLEEQNEIVDYLKEKHDELDGLIEKKMAFVEELETYKKSMIFEYVTGKKEVPRS